MRLTLRTLLAYRDQVLKPAEWEDMHARVQQSAMAANLLKRIESLANRPTILAPPVEGKGLGADANSIAEYLDDALKRDKVPELERICLESDVQLAELAQCHSLLSTALSTTVDIPSALRERVVSFGDPVARTRALAERPTGLTGESVSAAFPRAAPAPTADQALTRSGTAATESQPGAQPASDGRAGRMVKAQPVEAPMVASGGESIRPTGLDLEGSHLAHEVPEYLRGSTGDRWRGPLAIGALVAVLALLVWQSLGSWESVREMLADRSLVTATSSEPSSEPSSEASSTSAPATTAAAAAASSKAGSASANAAGARPATEPSSSDSAPSEPTTPSTPSSSTATSEAVAASTGVAGNASSTTRPAQPAVPHAAEWLPSDPQAMGAVILAYAGEALPLHRMQPAERLPSGTQVIVPPANRPKLDLANGPSWNFCGPTQMSVALPETGEQAVPQVTMRLGRALLSAGSQGQAVEIQTPDSRALLTLNDAAARIALELRYVAMQHGPMTDRNVNPPVLFVYAIEGGASISLRDANGQGSAPVSLQPGQLLMISAGKARPPEASEAPAWIEPSSDRPVDLLAAEDLQRQLTSNQPIGQTLHSLVANRRPETRALAAQTLAMLGSWDWTTVEKNTLNDSRDRSYWTPLLDLTRQVLAANPEDAKQLRNVLVMRDRERGALQADMWLGMTQAQLQNEGLSAMVGVLDSEVLLDRILAIYQLQRLTGKDFGYQAGEVNRASVQQWNRELASGRLQILAPGAASQ